MSTNASHSRNLGSTLETLGVRRDAVRACLVSMALHVVLFTVLGLIQFSHKIDVYATISSVMDFDQQELMLPTSDTAPSERVGDQSETAINSTSQQASAVLTRDTQYEIDKTIDTSMKVSAPVTYELPEPTKSDVLSTVATTGSTEHAGGVEGAIDRLTWEIANSLREKKTLVVWMFDVSPSLRDRREMIADRVENVYKQLNQLNVVSDNALKSAVAVFGEHCTIVTNKPLDDAADLVKTVRGIKSESSGDENTFAAVLKVANHFLSYRTEMRRDVMLIVVTDEEGTDLDNLEEAIVRCKRYGLRCYCVGDSAPFGRKNVEVPFQMDDGEKVIGVMQKGPETRYPELLRLGYWGVSGNDLDDMSSGYGPYGLTRLCTETNGLYFITDNGRGVHKFDPAVMRNYSPDYRPIPALHRDIQLNKAKQSLMDACSEVERETQNRKVLNISMPKLDFRAENDTVLRRELTEAQKPIAVIDASLDALLTRLELGEKDRAKIKEPRWQASYDLAIGRTLALRVRAFGYNSMLADMKANPKKFQIAENNQWHLIPSSRIATGKVVEKMASKATEILDRVIANHPGTPWALYAQRERNIPMGWEWKESHYDPPLTLTAGTRKSGPKIIEAEDPKGKPKMKEPVNNEPQRRSI